MVFYAYADLCSLLAATSQFSILIGQNIQLTGCHNGNDMRNATCADTQSSIEWPYCSFPILSLRPGLGLRLGLGLGLGLGLRPGVRVRVRVRVRVYEVPDHLGGA